MDIGLLSVSMNVYSTKRIAEEAENLGALYRVDRSHQMFGKAGVWKTNGVLPE